MSPSPTRIKPFLKFAVGLILMGIINGLKSDKCETVADLILKGTRNKRTKTAIWAIGSIDADLAARIIRAHWVPRGD